MHSLYDPPAPLHFTLRDADVTETVFMRPGTTIAIAALLVAIVAALIAQLAAVLAT